MLPGELPAGSPKESNCFLGTRGTTREDLASSPNSDFFRITAPGTRHAKLLELIGALFHQYGKETSRKQAEFQHTEASPAPVALLDEHLVEFDKAWAGMQRQWLRKLNTAERIKFDALTTDNERDAFRILRNWSQTDSPDFYAHGRTLAERLGMKSFSGAGKLRTKFCSLGILRKTAD